MLTKNCNHAIIDRYKGAKSAAFAEKYEVLMICG